jgi:hypothetical protein
MAVELLHPPLPAIQPRGALKATGLSVALTGRWVGLDATGAAIAPTAAQKGIYLILEGTHQHLGTPTEFAAGVSTNSAAYPSNNFSKAIALLYQPCIVTVGPEGVDQADAANIVAKAMLKVDILGRLLSTAVPAEAVAIVESRVMSGANILSVTYRVLAA